MTDAVTGAGPHVVHYDVRFPNASWEGWVVGAQLGGIPAEFADRLADGAEAQALVHRSVVKINAEALAKKGVIGARAIWVPDRSTGEVMAIMSVSFQGFPDGAATPEAYLGRNVKRDMGRRTKILEYASRVVEVPAGPATIEQFVLRLGGEKQVQGYLFFVIFPSGAREAVHLSFNTVHLSLLTPIAEQARVFADSLTVTLGEIPGGRRKPR